MDLLATPQNTFEVFYPFQLTLQAFGLFPKSFDGAVKNGNFKFQIRDKIWLSLVILFYVTLGFLSMWDSDLYTPRSAKMLQKAWLFTGILSLCVVIINVFYGIGKTENFKLLLELCCNFDLKVSSKKYYELRINS